MSSIIARVAAYLQQCPCMNDAQPANAQQTAMDRYDVARGYALWPVGQKVVARYMDGSQEIESGFALRLTDAASEDGTRMQNSACLEEVFAWIEQQSQRGLLPDLGQGRTARKMTANGMLPETMQGGAAAYQLQIQLTYFERGERSHETE